MARPMRPGCSCSGASARLVTHVLPHTFRTTGRVWGECHEEVVEHDDGMTTGAQLEIHYSDDDWAALYVDGLLDRVGDAYVVEERSLDLLGVTIVHDNSFLRGQDSRDGVAGTLDDVNAYRQAAEQAMTAADAKRAEAQLLLAEADALDPRHS